MKTHVFILISMLCCMFIAAPVAAVVYEPTWKGYVTSIDYETSIISVEITGTYGCEYINQADPICGFEAVKPQQISGEIYDAAVYDLITIGSPVIGKSFGGFESTQWSALAKIIEEDVTYIEALFGDTGLLDIAPLAAGYSVSFNDMVPDCDACTGTICPVTSVMVGIYSKGPQVSVDILVPGQATSYFERNDGSGVSVTFVSGEISYLACEADITEMMTGPQAIQDFTIIVTLPLDQASEFDDDDSQQMLGETTIQPPFQTLE